MQRLVVLLAVVVTVLGLSCAAPAPPAPPKAPSDDTARALALGALDAIEHRGCAQLLWQTFPLADPATHLSTGRVWPRRCTARRSGDGLRVEGEVVGWQWIAEQSSGFAVRDYVYFRATVRADLVADVRPAGGHVVLRLHAADPATVEVAALAEVRAHAANPAAALLGIATGIVGLGPSTIATNAMKGRVREVFIARASSGFELALDDPALTDASHANPAAEWLKESQGLFPRGALLSGSFAAGVTARLDYDIEGDATVLARPACVEEAAETIDTFLADKPTPVTQRGGVVELRHRGTAVLPALPCKWFLVTAVRDDSAATAKIELRPAARRQVSSSAGAWSTPEGTETWGKRRFVRATLVAFGIQATDPEGHSWDPQGGAPDPRFSIGPVGHAVRFGEALPNVLAGAPWLVSPLFEMTPNDVLEVRAVDLDPKPRSWLATSTEYEEQLVGEGRVEAEAVLRGEDVTVQVSKNGKQTGWARVRFASVRSE